MLYGKIICRDFEKSFPKLTKPCDRKNDNSPLLGLFYKELRLVNFAISITENDNCLILKDNSYCIVNEIFSINNKISLSIKKFDKKSTFFATPINSERFLNIAMVEELNENANFISISDIKNKCFRLQINSIKSLVIPLLHTE